MAGDYTDALCRNIYEFTQKTGKAAVDTVFIGGGTPSCIKSKYIGRIMSALKEAFLLSEDAEISMEINPATATKDDFSEYKAMGINRISFGVQSLNNIELKTLGRLHDREGFFTSLNHAVSAGFENINADVMMGIPHQNKESLLATLEEMAKLSLSHISAYMLKIEKGTPFWKNAHKLPLPDEDEVCDMYLLASEFLCSNGYTHYEISNFAKKGAECRHNLKYWKGVEYIGFGTGAHSYFNGVRYSYPKNIIQYIGTSCFIDLETEKVCIDEDEKRREEIIFGLRLREGINAANINIDSNIKMYIKHGFCFLENGRLGLTPKGMLLSNHIISHILQQI